MSSIIFKISNKYRQNPEYSTNAFSRNQITNTETDYNKPVNHPSFHHFGRIAGGWSLASHTRRQVKGEVHPGQIARSSEGSEPQVSSLYSCGIVSMCCYSNLLHGATVSVHSGTVVTLCSCASWHVTKMVWLGKCEYCAALFTFAYINA